jgi:hypothetical protein
MTYGGAGNVLVVHTVEMQTGSTKKFPDFLYFCSTNVLVGLVSSTSTYGAL